MFIPVLFLSNYNAKWSEAKQKRKPVGEPYSTSLGEEDREDMDKEVRSMTGKIMNNHEETYINPLHDFPVTKEDVANFKLEENGFFGPP